MFDTARFFERHMEKSVGCTEPAAIALSSSVAFNAIFGKLPKSLNVDGIGGAAQRSMPVMDETARSTDVAERAALIEEISVLMDSGTFKNAMNAVIPHTDGKSGADLAAALGVFCDPEFELMLFNYLNDEIVRAAMSILNRIHISYEDKDHIFIRTRVRLSDGTVSECVTKHLHTGIVSVSVNGNPIFASDIAMMDEDLRILEGMCVDDFIHVVGKLPENAKLKLKDALKTNISAYEIARDAGCARGVGVIDVIGGWVGEAAKMVHTAVECRMSGETMEVMTCAGSGNMGLTASLPLIALHRHVSAMEEAKGEKERARKKERAYGDDEDVLLRAFALAHLIANFVCVKSGYLSATCGCAIKAGIGVAAGIAYYLASSGVVDHAEDASGVADVVKTAINNMASDVTGIICEGASRKCALKASTAVISAAKSALLALKGVEFGGIGCAADATVTLNRVGEIARSMADTDREIVRMLQMNR